VYVSIGIRKQFDLICTGFLDNVIEVTNMFSTNNDRSTAKKNVFFKEDVEQAPTMSTIADSCRETGNVSD
jgi:hypothetical protein